MNTLALKSIVPPSGHKPSYETAVILSIIIPVYNESEVIEEFHQRLANVLNSIPQAAEIIYVNDGSSDDSWKKLQMLPPSGSEHVLISLSRNFGKESAVSAGLEHSRGDAVILIDSDLQDPPELIPDMITRWQGGADIVNMKRRKRHGESWLKKQSASAFYRLLNRLSDVPIPENVGDFRLLSRRVVDHLNQLPEKNRYMKGLFAWPGFHQEEILFDRDPRQAGETKWNYLKLFRLALDGITSFSVRPLQLASWVGAFTAGIAFIYACVIAVNTLIYGADVAGYPSTMVAILFMGGVQLMAVGLLGEYVGRIFIEIKGRPKYLVMQKTMKPAITKLQEVVAS